MRCYLRPMIAAVLSLACAPLNAATLATATFDTDSYVFVGTHNQFDPGITVTQDITNGVLDGANSHFTFGLIKYDVSSLTTKADGGGDKFLKLATSTVPGAATLGVSAAVNDIDSDTQGYPSGFFTGNPAGSEVDRLQWYMDNIKGNDASFGGYAGGAPHVGTIEVTNSGNYYLDVTTTVDAWIAGDSENNGFGLWGVNVPGGLGNTLDFVSSDGAGAAPTLVDVVPEPSASVLMLLGIAAVGWMRKA